MSNFTLGDQRFDLLLWILFGAISLISIITLTMTWSWTSNRSKSRGVGRNTIICLSAIFASGVGMALISTGPVARPEQIRLNSVNDSVDTEKETKTQELIKAEREYEFVKEQERLKKLQEKEEAESSESMRKFREQIMNRNKKEAEKK